MRDTSGIRELLRLRISTDSQESIDRIVFTIKKISIFSKCGRVSICRLQSLSIPNFVCSRSSSPRTKYLRDTSGIRKLFRLQNSTDSQESIDRVVLIIKKILTFSKCGRVSICRSQFLSKPNSVIQDLQALKHKTWETLQGLGNCLGYINFFSE